MGKVQIFEGVSAQWPVALRWQNLVLRPLKRRDRAEWDSVRAANAQWLQPWDATHPPVWGEADRLPTFGHMVRAMNRDARAGHSFPWVLCVQQPGQHHARVAGQVVAAPVQWGSVRSTALGYWVDHRLAGRNIVPTAVALAIDYLFDRVGLHRVEINIVPQNIASHRVVEKVGMRYEGLRKNYLHINGMWTDHDSFAITTEEWPLDGLVAQLQADFPLKQ
ncbi:GNAT family protein [Auritidibacter ignavus]|nr:GNAT family protein [Auritidibacter ignavus]WGH90821.1 GNAT family protein [Auritidibacter ignavus]WHS28456.1 GNAT family protein [Auritidibacter ignavus]